MIANIFYVNLVWQHTMETRNITHKRFRRKFSRHFYTYWVGLEKCWIRKNFWGGHDPLTSQWKPERRAPSWNINIFKRGFPTCDLHMEHFFCPSQCVEQVLGRQSCWKGEPWFFLSFHMKCNFFFCHDKMLFFLSLHKKSWYRIIFGTSSAERENSFGTS